MRTLPWSTLAQRSLFSASQTLTWDCWTVGLLERGILLGVLHLAAHEVFVIALTNCEICHSPETQQKGCVSAKSAIAVVAFLYVLSMLD